MLLRMGCELAQGFAIARPMPADQVAGWIAGWRPPQSWQHCRPLKRDAIPTLAALIGHRAWLRRLDGLLRGPAALPAEGDGTDARCGRWLAASAAGHPTHPAMARAAALHDTIHRDGDALLAQARQGDRDAALGGLAAIEACSQEMVEALESLLSASLE
jgi:hypothetical protein